MFDVPCRRSFTPLPPCPVPLVPAILSTCSHTAEHQRQLKAVKLHPSRRLTSHYPPCCWGGPATGPLGVGEGRNQPQPWLVALPVRHTSPTRGECCKKRKKKRFSEEKGHRPAGDAWAQVPTVGPSESSPIDLNYLTGLWGWRGLVGAPSGAALIGVIGAPAWGGLPTRSAVTRGRPACMSTQNKAMKCRTRFNMCLV